MSAAGRVESALRRRIGSLTGPGVRPQPADRVADAGSWRQEDVAAQMEALVLEQLAAATQPAPFRAFLRLLDLLLADGLPQPARLVDLGCGVGHYSELVERAHPGRFLYSGLDFAPPMVERARRLWPQREFAVADLFDPAVAARPADIVLAGALVDVVADAPGALATLARGAAATVILHRQTVTRGASFSEVADGYRGQLTYRSHLNRRDIERIARESGREIAHEVKVEGAIWSFALRKAAA